MKGYGCCTCKYTGKSTGILVYWYTGKHRGKLGPDFDTSHNRCPREINRPSLSQLAPVTMATRIPETHLSKIYEYCLAVVMDTSGHFPDLRGNWSGSQIISLMAAQSPRPWVEHILSIFELSKSDLSKVEYLDLKTSELEKNADNIWPIYRPQLRHLSTNTTARLRWVVRSLSKFEHIALYYTWYRATKHATRSLSVI